jgi:hypothetical protein
MIDPEADQVNISICPGVSKMILLGKISVITALGPFQRCALLNC